jgi:hypothetical protein
VSPGGKQKEGIRRDLERITLQIVEGFIHGLPTLASEVAYRSSG